MSANATQLIKSQTARDTLLSEAMIGAAERLERLYRFHHELAGSVQKDRLVVDANRRIVNAVSV